MSGAVDRRRRGRAPEPQTESLLRENVARVIDPEAVDQYDNLPDFANMATPENRRREAAYLATLAKADAILRLPAISQALEAKREVEGDDDGVEAFLNEVRRELRRARAKFPGDRIMTVALAEEFGELCKAVLDEPAANVRKEAVQTAVMAARVVLDGDGSVRDWRAAKGLDPIGAIISREAAE